MEYTKITREQIVSFLDTTPSGNSRTWALIGVGITEFAQAYNAQTTTEKWIIHKNAVTTTDSYQISGSISQKCYKGDAVFEFVNNIRRNASVGAACVTNILDVDTYDETSGSYAATMYECNIAIDSYGGEEAVIEYTISYNGDPKLGTVTITDGVPTFTPSV